jgi:hypothetical protein
MPKLFSISIKVEEIAVGRVMSLLHHTAGVAKLDLDMGDAKPKPNGKAPTYTGKPKKTYEIQNKDFLIGVLAKAKGPISAKQLKEAFTEDGRGPASVNSLVWLLKNEGLLGNTGDGWFLTKKMKDRLRHRVSRKAAKHG